MSQVPGAGGALLRIDLLRINLLRIFCRYHRPYDLAAARAASSHQTSQGRGGGGGSRQAHSGLSGGPTVSKAGGEGGGEGGGEKARRRPNVLAPVNGVGGGRGGQGLTTSEGPVNFGFGTFGEDTATSPHAWSM